MGAEVCVPDLGSSENHSLERFELGSEWQAWAGSPLPELVWPGDALEGHGSSWMIFFVNVPQAGAI